MPDQNPIRVVLVDDHAQMHRIVQQTLDATPDIKLVGQGADGICQSTLKFHLTNIYQKLGVHTRSEALVLAAKNNLI